MKSTVVFCCFFVMFYFSNGQILSNLGLPTVKTANGFVQGVYVSGISIFKGIPYAQPPVGDLRWKEPQPVKNWEGTKKADHFSARAMQLPIYSDMKFRSDGVSEDCLYLNIWTPAKTGREELPVLVYFYGGGFKAGDGSEFRYDGEMMSRRGIIAITVNYRLGVFGFLAHPDLSKESVHHSSGNYGLMDQTEALRWIHKNISAFGGNPDNITIAGESAGSTSVNAQLVSPLPRNLFSAAIGESGSLMKFDEVRSLTDAEKIGLQFSNRLGESGIREMRTLPAEQILQATAKPDTINFPIDLDGYFFPESPLALYNAGKIARVPLMVGWNSEEASWRTILKNEEPTKENFILAVKKLYPGNADELLKLYAVSNDADVTIVATALAGDRARDFGSWKWAELHAKTNNPVYRYYFTKARPVINVDLTKTDNYFRGAAHSAEIEYALGNLSSNRVYDWQPDDFMVSAILQEYFLNFIKTKNPNGTGLPYWPLFQSWQKDPILFIGVDTHREPEKNRDRYIYFEKTGLR